MDILTPSLSGQSLFQDPWIIVSFDTSRRKFPSYMDTYIAECRQKFPSRIELKGLRSQNKKDDFGLILASTILSFNSFYKKYA